MNVKTSWKLFKIKISNQTDNNNLRKNMATNNTFCENWIWGFRTLCTTLSTSSPPEVFLRKGILKIRSKFTGEHSCRSAISIKLQNNFIEIALRHGYFSVNLLYIFRIYFPKNTYGGLLLNMWVWRRLKIQQIIFFFFNTRSIMTRQI